MSQILSLIYRIAIDHGWEFVKTLHHMFLAGVNEILTEPAFFDNVVEYNGKYYKVGTKRGAVMDSKVETEEYYILTLAAIAMELKYSGLHEATIVIGAGLPATRYGAEKKEFAEYLSRNRDVTFKFEGEEYKIKLEKVALFPQGYAAAVEDLPYLGSKVVVVDVGSWTTDIFPINNKKPDDANANSIPGGVISCMRTINKHSVRLFNEKIDEEAIVDYIATGKTNLDKKYVELIDKTLKEFATDLFNSLREEGYSLKTTQFYFVGGGAAVMKRFGGIEQKNIRYNLDLKANARGYDKLTKIAMERNARKS